MNGRIEITALVPHAGSMRLLERLVSWDERCATVVTTSHASPANPLRREGRLSALCLCEYGAQAMAIHGALVARAAGKTPVPGLLVSLREIELRVASVESMAGELCVAVERLADGAAGLQYAFRVSHEGTELARGRAAIIESRVAP
jgi:predicted hotdog family 3-hydroxylacyl-ACP dehydratase